MDVRKFGDELGRCGEAGPYAPSNSEPSLFCFRSVCLFLPCLSCCSCFVPTLKDGHNPFAVHIHVHIHYLNGLCVNAFFV